AVSALVAGIYAVQRRRRTARLRPRRPDAASHVQITVHNNLHRRHWPRTTSISPSERLVARARLLNEFGAKTRELLSGDGACLLEPIELLNLVGSAETHHTPQLLACLRSLLAASFGHASRLSYQVCEYAEIGEHD